MVTPKEHIEFPAFTDEEECDGTDDWIPAVRAQYFVNQVEFSAIGYDAPIPSVWRGENAQQTKNQAS
jgi:hypothetical protein